MRHTSQLILGVVLVVLFSGRLGHGQILSPDGPEQKKRFDTVTKAVAKAGYKDPVIVGLSEEPDHALFALLATHKGQGVLVIAIEPGKDGGAHPIDVETEKTPADIGVGGITFAPSFIGEKDLVDVCVSHRPFRLEMSHSFDLHHIVRKSDVALNDTCDFNGNSASSVAKGPRSMTSKTTVTVQKADVPQGEAFDVKAVTENTESYNDKSAPPTTETTESTTRYHMIESGSFVPVK